MCPFSVIPGRNANRDQKISLGPLARIHAWLVANRYCTCLLVSLGSSIEHFAERVKYCLYLEKLAGQRGVVPAVFVGHSICAIGQSLYSPCSPGTRAFCATRQWRPRGTWKIANKLRFCFISADLGDNNIFWLILCQQFMSVLFLEKQKLCLKPVKITIKVKITFYIIWLVW